MSYTDLRDFEAEYTTTDDSSFPLTIEIEKLGGGTLGKAYEGYWRYRVTDPNGGILYQGQDLYTGTPKKHYEIPAILRDFLVDEILAYRETL